MIVNSALNAAGKVYLNTVYKKGLDSLRNSQRDQERLFKIFKQNMHGTALGNDIGLEKYSNYKDFINNFDAKNYDYYEPYVNRIVAGEQNIMYKGKTEYLFVTSGTSGFNNKVIPCDSNMKESIVKFQKKVLATILQVSDNMALTSDRFMYGSRPDFERVNGIPKGYISGVMSALTPGYLKESVVPTIDALGETCWETKVNSIIKEARDKDIRAVAGVPAYLVHVFKDIIEKLQIKNMREIWPNLDVCLYSGTPVVQYQSILNKLTGADLKYVGAYISTESPMGFEVYNVANGSAQLCFVPDLILYSFKDLNSTSSELLTIDELKEGGEYLVNIGTPNGLIHYAMNDYIKVTAVSPYLQFEVQGRYGSAMNVAAEKVSLSQISKAVDILQDTSKTMVEHYFVYPSEDSANQPCYEWVFATNDETDLNVLSTFIDDALMQVSEDYKEARLDENLLGKPIVKVVSPLLTRNYFEKKQSVGQFKMKTAFKNKHEFDLFYENMQS